MPIKINKIVVLTFFLLSLTIRLLGIPAIWTFQNMIEGNSIYSTPLIMLFVENLLLNISLLSPLIIGMWFYFSAEKMMLDKWTWLLLGFLYADYALLLMGMVIIIQSNRISLNIFKSLVPILVLLIINRFLVPSFQMLSKPLLVSFGKEVHALSIEYTRYISLISVMFLLVVNIILAVKLKRWIKSLNIQNGTIWVISTIFLGLFPIILFNELSIIRTNE